MKSVKVCIFIVLFIIIAYAASAQGICMKIADANHINDFALVDEYLWIATDGGVIRLNTVDDTTELYTTENGLISNYITSITVDSKGVVWFGSYDGITTFNGNDWETYTETDEDGPASNFITDIAEDNPCYQAVLAAYPNLLKSSLIF